MARINKMEMMIIKTVYYPNAAGWRKEETVGGRVSATRSIAVI